MYLQLPPRHKVANLIKQIIDLYHLPPGMVHLKSRFDDFIRPNSINNAGKLNFMVKIVENYE